MATISVSRPRMSAGAFESQMKVRRTLAVIALVALIEQSLVGFTPFSVTLMSDADAQGSVARQVVTLATLAMLLLGPSSARPPMAVPPSVVLLFGFCLLSCTWAIAPDIALRRLAFTAAVVFVLVRAAGDLGAVRTLKTLRVILGVMLAINYLAVMFSPNGKHLALLEVEALVGDWRGILMHKNIAGSVCGMTILLFTFDAARVNALLRGLVITGSLIFLYMSNSKTSMAAVAVALAFGGLTYFYNPHRRSIAVPLLIVGGIALAALGTAYFGALETMLDDPGAFTGRAAIWSLLLEYGGQHLWTGAGYMSFWQIGPDSPILAMTSDWVATLIGHGHNGYLDILITLGLPGLLLTLVVLFVWPAIRLLCSLSIARSRRMLFFALMIFCAVHNLAESSLLDRVSIMNILLVITVVLIHRLSDQSAGAHQALRDRIAQLANRTGIGTLRARLAGRTRLPQPRTAWRRRAGERGAADRGVEDGIA